MELSHRLQSRCCWSTSAPTSDASRRTRRRERCSRRSPVLILAFDTATDVATSALVADGVVLGERVSDRELLLADVDELLRDAGLVAIRPHRGRRRDGAGQLHGDADRALGRARPRSRARGPGRRRLDARRSRRRRRERVPGDRRPSRRGLRSRAAGRSTRGRRTAARRRLRRERRAALSRAARARRRRRARRRLAAPPPARRAARIARDATSGRRIAVEPVYVRLPDAERWIA